MHHCRPALRFPYPCIRTSMTFPDPRRASCDSPSVPVRRACVHYPPVPVRPLRRAQPPLLTSIRTSYIKSTLFLLSSIAVSGTLVIRPTPAFPLGPGSGDCDILDGGGFPIARRGAGHIADGTAANGHGFGGGFLLPGVIEYSQSVAGDAVAFRKPGAGGRSRDSVIRLFLGEVHPNVEFSPVTDGETPRKCSPKCFLPLKMFP